MRKQLAPLDVKQAISHGDNDADVTRAVVKPTGLIGIVGQNADGSQRLEQIANLSAGWSPWHQQAFLELERLCGEVVEQAAHAAVLNFPPVR